MPAISTAIAVGSLAVAGAGVYTQYQGADDAADAQAGITAQEQELEKQRKKQLMLDSQRARLETIRRAQMTRSMSLATATSQGASQVGSSALPGAYGQTSGQMYSNLLGINQNQQIGLNMFDINSQMAMYKMQMAQAQSQMYLGSGMTSLGVAGMNSAGTLGNLFASSPAPTATTASYTPWYASNSPTMQGPLPF